MAEVWKDVPGWEGFYMVSNEGRVRSLDRVIYAKNPKGVVGPRRYRGRILGTSRSKAGYPLVVFTRPGVKFTTTVHGLVAKVFIGAPPPGQQVRHRDGIRHHCSVNNLEYGTPSDNSNDRHWHGTMVYPRGISHPMAKLKLADVQWVKEHVGKISMRAMAKTLGVTHGVVSRAARGHY